jgi:hypothetical protein
MGENIQVYKAGALLLLFEITLVVHVQAFIEINTGREFPPFEGIYRLKYYAPALLLLITINYFMFMYKDKWKKYIPQFQTYSPQKCVRINITIILLFTINIVGYFFVTAALWGYAKRDGLIVPFDM